jgi:hypothetical protein
MKLYATVTSERAGRAAQKGGNEYITVTFSNGNVNVFDVKFYPDDFLGKRGRLDVVSYRNGEDGKVTIDY